MTKDRVKCKTKVRQRVGFARYSRCDHWAAKDGYCTIHHPDRIAEKQAKGLREMEALRRASAREFLEKRVGSIVLKAVEHGGRMHVEDYSKVDPRWVLSLYDPKEKT